MRWRICFCVQWLQCKHPASQRGLWMWRGQISVKSLPTLSSHGFLVCPCGRNTAEGGGQWNILNHSGFTHSHLQAEHFSAILFLIEVCVVWSVWYDNSNLFLGSCLLEELSFDLWLWMCLLWLFKYVSYKQHNFEFNFPTYSATMCLLTGTVSLLTLREMTYEILCDLSEEVWCVWVLSVLKYTLHLFF